MVSYSERTLIVHSPS